MFRYSSGLLSLSGNNAESEKGYSIYQGALDNGMMSRSKLWEFDQTHPDGRRFWNLKRKGKYQALVKPLKDDFSTLLIEDLDTFEVNRLHPSLENSTAEEVRRLFPDIEDSVVSKVEEFMIYLNDEFDFSIEGERSKALGTYCDDLGPCMIGLLDGYYVLPPELPNLYMAPKAWRNPTWLINNHFSGPYPNDPETQKVMNGQRFHWGSLSITDEVKKKEAEGLVYFLLTRFILIYEKWMDRSSADSLVEYFDLVQRDEHRPWQLLY